MKRTKFKDLALGQRFATLERQVHLPYQKVKEFTTTDPYYGKPIQINIAFIADSKATLGWGYVYDNSIVYIE